MQEDADAMGIVKKLEARCESGTLWQIAKFNLVSFEGLSEEDLAVYRRCAETIGANIRRRLLAEETGNG